MGGILAFRDKGLFWKNFSDFDAEGNVVTDVGILLKVKQIPATATTLTAECPAGTSWPGGWAVRVRAR